MVLWHFKHANSGSIMSKIVLAFASLSTFTYRI